MKTIVFVWQRGIGAHNKYTEEFVYEDDVAEEEIHKDYEAWIWNQIGDQFTWYEKDK